MSLTTGSAAAEIDPTAAQVVKPRRGVRLWAAGFLAAAAMLLSLFGASSAGASVPIAGVTFSSVVTCSSAGDGLEVSSWSNFRGGSSSMIYLYNARTGTWIHENQWHDVSGGFQLLIHDAFNFVGHGYYRVYMAYAQYTTAGWQYNGEYINRYSQRNSNGYGSYASSTCYI